jgi:RNA polymerase sigma-70 factor (ECF subfamily)
MDESKRFYEEYSKKLFSYLVRMTGDYDLSQDILQESFARYLEHYGRDTRNVSLLYTIARNAFFDHERGRKKLSTNEEALENCSADQEKALAVREECRHVLAGIQKLDDDERDLLVLVVTGDLSYRQIASIAGISEANVKVKVHRARVKLKTILQEGDI